MAARTLLLKLERAGHVRLPARRGSSPNGRRNREVVPVAPPSEPVRGTLRGLQPLDVSVVAPGSDGARLFLGLLAHEHYLGQRNTVGENMRYLVRDRHDRPVACPDLLESRDSARRRGSARPATPSSAGTAPRANATCNA